MTKLFDALSTSFGRFVYAWLLPSATVAAVFSLLLLPDLKAEIGVSGRLNELTPVEAGAIFAIAVFLLSALFAYASQPLYRLLEGYTMPGILKKALLRRRLREWHRLQARRRRQTSNRGELLERLAAYPRFERDVLPTRLGNALRATERYGTDRYGIDTQSLWYELNNAVPESLRRDIEDARAGVDFFVSVIAHLVLLAAVSLGIGIASGHTAPAVVGLISVAGLPAAYSGAVLNVGELRLAVQALVNVGRPVLPGNLGLELPRTFEEERRMWILYRRLVQYGVREAELDLARAHVAALTGQVHVVAAAEAVKTADEQDQGR
jgi:hypothetical protein